MPFFFFHPLGINSCNTMGETNQRTDIKDQRVTHASHSRVKKKKESTWRQKAACGLTRKTKHAASIKRRKNYHSSFAENGFKQKCVKTPLRMTSTTMTPFSAIKDVRTEWKEPQRPDEML